MSTSLPKLDSKDDEWESTLQQRADYIPLDDLLSETAPAGSIFSTVVKELTNRSLRTIVGPRGCGKTHMMRFAWLNCRNTPSKPFAVFSSFQRYFRLEPLLSTNAGASQLFHSWVLARILLSAKEGCDEWLNPKIDASAVLLSHGYPVEKLSGLAAKLERNQSIDAEYSSFSDSLSIDNTKAILDELREKSGRKFTVLLLDDAAMTLTPDYLIEFLDIMRSLKSQSIAPKASVYPGTTEVSPRFHQGQDAHPIPAWISVETADYSDILQEIARVRVKALDDIPDEVQAILRFAAFGIPRAYLSMLEEYQRHEFHTSQQGTNRIVGDHIGARISEFRTLGAKIPKFEILVNIGEAVLQSIGREFKAYNSTLLEREEKGLVYGIVREKLSPLLERMFKLLAEVGLIFDDGEVKHGTPGRIYKKFIPHTALLLSTGVFNDSSKAAGSLRQIAQAIAYKSTKHPLRKSLETIVGPGVLDKLNLALPKCAFCGTTRLTDNQRFCHYCAHQLVDASIFNTCLDVQIVDVPGITEWQKNQISTHLPHLRTIRDYLAKQDPAAELLTVSGFGTRRTAKIIDVLNSFVDDYLS
jgi:hypothetical protein